MALLKDTTIVGGLNTGSIKNSNGVTVIDTSKLDPSDTYIRQYFIQEDLVSRNFSTAWGLATTFDVLRDFKAGSLIDLYYLIPMRNDSTSWGGAYIEPQVRFLSKNMVTNSNLSTGWSSDYQNNIAYNDTPPPVGISSDVVGFNRGNTSGYWYSYGDYVPKNKGETYTCSLYVKTLDPNFQIKFYTADNSETGRYNSEFITVPNDGEWHRIVWLPFVNPLDSASASLSFNFSYQNAINDPNTRTWLCAPQLEFGDTATNYENGQTIWQSLGSCGYDGGVMGSGGARIISYRNFLLIDPEQTSDFNVQFRFYCRSYNGTAQWNNSRDIGLVSGTAPLLDSTINKFHHAHIKVKEIARLN